MIIRTTCTLFFLAAAIGLLWWRADLDTFFATLGSVSAPTVLIALALLIAGALLASLRLKVIAKDVGYQLSFGDSLAALSVGQLVGGLFFQLAGQLIARTAMLSRRNIPTAANIVMVGYERMAALAVSLLLAACGAIYLFGQLTIDMSGGGLALVRLAAGLTAAILVGAEVGWFKSAWPFLQTISANTALKFLRSLAISVLIQMTTMASYVVVASYLAPGVSTPNLLAASTIVMLAASIPISLAGWGIREASSVAALGFVGVPISSALSVAVLIGTLAMLAVAILALSSIRFWRAGRSAAPRTNASTGLNYTAAVQYALPLALATFVCFQIYVPLQSGHPLNINLGDPLAGLGGLLFIVLAARGRRLPTWREPFVNETILAATAILTLSLIIGGARFGFTSWALVNKYAGWFMLLCYGATGAMVVNLAGDKGLRAVALTFVGATTGIAGLDIILTLIHSVMVSMPPDILPLPLSGFAQNRNAFSFQCLMAMAAALACAERRTKVALCTVLFVGIFFAGSRAALVSMVPLLCAAAHLRRIQVRGVLVVLAGAVAVVAAAYVVASISGFGGVSEAVIPQTQIAVHDVRNFVQNGIATASDDQHFQTLVAAFRLFLTNPFFGAGLGAFYLKASSLGAPLVIHSTILWLLAETGLVGAVVFVAPSMYLIWRNLNGEHIGAAIVCLCLVAFASMSLFHELLYQRSLWLLIGAGLALANEREACGTTTPHEVRESV